MKRFFIAFILIANVMSLTALADIHYVTVSGAGVKDGSSWSNAHEGLQAALTASASGDQIWVQAGTYYTSEVSGSASDRNQSFNMKNGVAIFGGFSGTEGSTSQRYGYEYGGINETIISGDIGEQGENTDNSYYVFSNNSDINTSAILDGFTICDGYVMDRGSSMDYSGAGIKNYYASPTIRNCTFHNNNAFTGGAISFFYGGVGSVVNCVFFNNSASYVGGATMGFNTNNHKYVNCVFKNNQVSGYGGASSETFCTNPQFINCVFTGNLCPNNGGGAVSIAGSTGSSIINCTFRNNTGNRGGAVYSESNTISIYNSIFYNNEGISSGDHLYGATVLYNSCIYPYNDNSGAGVQTNSIYCNPCFAGEYDSRLLPCSPCINWGNSTYCSELTDIDGNARKFESIDLGAYEYNSLSYSNTFTSNPVDNSNNISGICKLCDGVTAGILVSESIDPVYGGQGVLYYTISPDALGQYSVELTGLEQGRTYFYRLYRHYPDGNYVYTESRAFTAIPTLGEWGLIAFASLIAVYGAAVVWKKFVV